MNTRDRAVVEYVRDDDERGLTTWIGMACQSGGHQGFGQIIHSPETLADWKSSIAALFGVATYEEIVGRQCFILRSWPEWDSDIEGIEVDGKRFTITDFGRKHWPARARTQLEKRRERLLHDIQHHARRIAEDTARLEHLGDEYVEWSAPEKGEVSG